MGLTSLQIPLPINKLTPLRELDYELLDVANHLHEQGQHMPSVETALRHILGGPTISLDTPYVFTQGSSEVTVAVADAVLIVRVPMVRLGATSNRVAAMRFLLERISGSGQLHQPRLMDDNVVLEYRERLDHIHPSKLLEVLRRMPVEADSYDDWMVNEFAAEPLARAKTTDLTPEELDRAHGIWAQHWQQVDDLLKEGRRKRSIFFLNELTAFAHTGVKYYLPVNGVLGALLSEYARVFNDGDEDPTKREASLAKCVVEMKAVDAPKLAGNLAHASYAISPLGDGSSAVLRHFLGHGNYRAQVEQLWRTGKAMDAGLALVSSYIYMLGRYAWPDGLGKVLQAGLQEASGKPWKELAEELLACGDAIIDAIGDDDEAEEDADEAPDGEAASNDDSNEDATGGGQ